MSRRGVAPVTGVVLLVLVTLLLATVVGAMALGMGAESQTSDAPTAAIGATFGNEDPNQINLTHQGGDTLDVRDLTIKVFVDGTPLEKQPPVPFFSVHGFHPGPTGPFNANTADKNWTAGETASFTIASTTNAPQPTAGSLVTVKIYSHNQIVASAHARN